MLTLSQDTLIRVWKIPALSLRAEVELDFPAGPGPDYAWVDRQTTLVLRVQRELWTLPAGRRWTLLDLRSYVLEDTLYHQLRCPVCLETTVRAQTSYPAVPDPDWEELYQRLAATVAQKSAQWWSHLADDGTRLMICPPCMEQRLNLQAELVARNVLPLAIVRPAAQPNNSASAGASLSLSPLRSALPLASAGRA